MSRLYVGNLERSVRESILYELMIQVAPVESVQIRQNKDGAATKHAFVDFADAGAADYAIEILGNVRLHGKILRLSRSNMTSTLPETVPSGAKLFVGNLDRDLVTDEVLALPFRSFGQVEEAVVVRDETGASRGHGFVTFNSFAAADKAIKALDGQYLMNRVCNVTYAFKPGTTEKHGDAAERRIAEGAERITSPRPAARA